MLFRSGPVVHQALGIPDSEILISGMALGVADWNDPLNRLETERVSAEEFAVVHEA